MPESVCFSMIFGNGLGRSFSPSSNSSWCTCFTYPCGSRRKPSADKPNFVVIRPPPAGIHTPVTIKRCGGLLRNGPITRRGIQFRVDRTGLHVVDRDAPATDLSGQRLSEHLDRSLRPRVRHKSGRCAPFAHCPTDHDDASTPRHVV